MNPFYKLFCAAALLLTCGTSAESAWENLARNPDTTLWSQESSQKVLRCLTDGSREIGMVTGENRGRILNFRFPATRQIDHIVLFTPYRRDAAVPRQVTLLLDGREFRRLELPDLPRRAIRIEVNREAASVSLRIDSMHGGEAPGGFAEVEINAAAEGVPFRSGPESWYPEENITLLWRPGEVTFSGAPAGGRFARRCNPLDLSRVREVAVSCEVKGSPCSIRLMLVRGDGDREYLALRESRQLQTAGSETYVKLAGELTIPENLQGTPLSGELQIHTAKGANSTVSIRNFDFRLKGEVKTAAVDIPRRWHYRFAPFTACADRSWTRCGFDDSSWKSYPVPGRPEEPFRYGLMQSRTTVQMKHGGAYRLNVGRIKGNDTTFFNGIKVGETFGVPRSFDERPDYLIPAEAVRNGANVIAVEGASGYRDAPGIHAGRVLLRPLADDEYHLQTTALGEHESALFPAGSRVRYRIRLHAGASPAGKEVRVICRARDFFGNPAAQEETVLPLKAGGAETVLELPVTQTGYYRVEFRCLAGERVLAERESSFAILFDLSRIPCAPEDSAFGVNSGMDTGRNIICNLAEYPLMKLAGIDHVRTGISWDMVEAEKGVYDWSFYDLLFREMARSGLTVFPFFEYAPSWATASTVPTDSGQYQQMTGRPDDLDAWEKFVAAFARRYRPYLKECQLGNEPNHRSKWQCDFRNGGAAWYVESLRRAAEAIRRNAPECRIISPGLASTDVNYLNKLRELGAFPAFDAVSYHPYRTQTTPEDPDKMLTHWDPSAGTGTIFEEEAAMRRTAAADGVDRPLYVTEFSWRIHHPRLSVVSPERQAQYIVRYLAMAMAGHRRLFWYEFRHANFGKNGWSILNPDNTPAPSLVAFQVFCRFLRGSRYESRKTDRDGIYQMNYRDRTGRAVAVVWTTRERSALALTCGTPVEIRDIMGRKIRQTAAGEQLLLPLSENPLYLLGECESAIPVQIETTPSVIAPGETGKVEIRLVNPFKHAKSFVLENVVAPDYRITFPAGDRRLTLAPGTERRISAVIEIPPAARLKRHDIPLPVRIGETESAAALRLRIGWRTLPGEEAGWIDRFLLLGPIPAPGLLQTAAAEESQLSPREGELCAGRRWTACRGQDGATDALPGAVDLATPGFAGEKTICYAFVRIHSPRQESAVLRLGSDDGIAAMLNGREVWRNESRRSVTPDEDAAEITLEKGWNRLLLKISNAGGGSGFIVRFTDRRGRPLPDLHYSIEPEQDSLFR